MIKEEVEDNNFIAGKIFPYVFIIIVSILFWPISLVAAYDTAHNLITGKSILDEKSPHYFKIIVTCFIITIISYGVIAYKLWFSP